MDMVAAIQAAKNQLEADKSRRQPHKPKRSNSFVNQPADAAASTGDNLVAAGSAAGYQKSKSFHFGGGVPVEPPPTSVVSFDSSKKYGRKVSDLSSSHPHPYHNVPLSKHADYIHPDYQFNPGLGDDDTITSSLSGTLPDLGTGRKYGQAVALIPAGPTLTRDHQASLTVGRVGGSTGTGSPEKKATTSHMLPRPGVPSPPSAVSSNNITPQDPSFANATTTGPTAATSTTAAAAAAAILNSSTRSNTSVNSNNSSSTLSRMNMNSNTSNSSSDAARRIEEIMSAYQGKVDTILKKRNDDNNTPPAVGVAGGSSAAGNAADGSAKKGGNDTRIASGTVANYRALLKNPANKSNAAISTANTGNFNSGGIQVLGGGIVNNSPSLGGLTMAAEDIKINDILSTYKKKVGEIMSKSSFYEMESSTFHERGGNILPSKAQTDGPSFHEDNPLEESDYSLPTNDYSVPSRAGVGYLDMIHDDEDSDGRETAIDENTHRSYSTSGSRASEGSCSHGSNGGSHNPAIDNQESQSHSGSCLGSRSRSRDSRRSGSRSHSHGSHRSRGSQLSRGSRGSHRSRGRQGSGYSGSYSRSGSEGSMEGSVGGSVEDSYDSRELGVTNGVASVSLVSGINIRAGGVSPPPVHDLPPTTDQVKVSTPAMGSMSERANAILQSISSPETVRVNNKNPTNMKPSYTKQHEGMSSHSSLNIGRNSDTTDATNAVAAPSGGEGSYHSSNNNSYHTKDENSYNPTNDPNDDDVSENNQTRSNSEGTGGEGSMGADDSYISGASSASEFGTRTEGAKYCYYDDQESQQRVELLPQDDNSRLPRKVVMISEGRNGDEDRGGLNEHPEEDGKTQPAKQASFRRKDSLTRAQELTSSSISNATTTKSFHREDSSQTKRKLLAQIDSERKHRQETERRLVEANQREQELSRENRRLEKNLGEVQSSLDKVHAEARSSRRGASEQISKIKDLERKLKSEKERYDELERERDAMREEYDQDLEEQKDINRQLEQMVMSEEFEKELEDEIEQVKELEHANRRFRVKIDMLERERNAMAKRHDARAEEWGTKVSGLEGRLAEWEVQAGSLESKNREAEEEWEANLVEEKRRYRELQFVHEKAQTKVKSMETELKELRDSCSKIEEYEQVLGKLMERNEELETEAQCAKEEVEVARRQAEIADRRRTLKARDLEAKIEEQRVMIEQQQETLDESVKTILKLYSLNNEGGGDDFSVLSEEKLTDMARAMVPRVGGATRLPIIRDNEGVGGETLTLASGYSSHVSRANTIATATTALTALATRHQNVVSIGTSRGRELTEEVENLMQEQEQSVPARSRGRNRLAEADLDVDMQEREQTIRARSRGRNRLGEAELDVHTHQPTNTSIVPRSKSRGRGGERTETMRQLTERARTPARTRSQSPTTQRSFVRRKSSGEQQHQQQQQQQQQQQPTYDPSGPASESRALVPVANTENFYSDQHDILPSLPLNPRSSSRGLPRYDVQYNNSESTSYSSSWQQQTAYDKQNTGMASSSSHRSSHNPHQRGGDRHQSSSGSSYRSHHRHGRDRLNRDHHDRDRRWPDNGRDRDHRYRERDGRGDHHSRSGDRDRRDRGERDRERDGRGSVWVGGDDQFFRGGGVSYRDRSGVRGDARDGARSNAREVYIDRDRLAGNSGHRGDARSKYDPKEENPSPSTSSHRNSHRSTRDPSVAGDSVVSGEGGGGRPLWGGGGAGGDGRHHNRGASGGRARPASRSRRDP